MTEELQNINTDLKELFVAQKYEEMIQTLDALEDARASELMEENYNIVAKYLEQGRMDLIRTYLTFVAFTSFVFEYSYKRGLILQEEFDTKSVLYQTIYEQLQQ